MIDIFIVEERDTIGISIEFAETIMTEEDARVIVAKWSDLVKCYISHNGDLLQQKCTEKITKYKPCILF